MPHDVCMAGEKERNLTGVDILFTSIGMKQLKEWSPDQKKKQARKTCAIETYSFSYSARAVNENCSRQIFVQSVQRLSTSIRGMERLA